MQAIDKVLSNKKLNLFVSAIWILVLSNLWTPWLGEPSQSRFDPIWTLERSEVGRHPLTENWRTFPSMEVFVYSSQTIITLMGVLFLFKGILEKHFAAKLSFAKSFLALCSLLALTGGWNYIRDYDTTKVIDIIQEFVFGFYTALAKNNSSADIAFACSVTFWLCVLRLLSQRREHSDK
jgi:hypothetical protein